MGKYSCKCSQTAYIFKTLGCTWTLSSYTTYIEQDRSFNILTDGEWSSRSHSVWMTHAVKLLYPGYFTTELDCGLEV